MSTINEPRVQYSSKIVIAPTITDRTATALYGLLDAVVDAGALANRLPNYALQFDVLIQLLQAERSVRDALDAIAKSETDGGPR